MKVPSKIAFYSFLLYFFSCQTTEVDDQASLIHLQQDCVDQFYADGEPFTERSDCQGTLIFQWGEKHVDISICEEAASIASETYLASLSFGTTTSTSASNTGSTSQGYRSLQINIKRNYPARELDKNMSFQIELPFVDPELAPDMYAYIDFLFPNRNDILKPGRLAPNTNIANVALKISCEYQNPTNDLVRYYGHPYTTSTLPQSPEDQIIIERIAYFLDSEGNPQLEFKANLRASIGHQQSNGHVRDLGVLNVERIDVTVPIPN